jgi:D-aminoacyl-tRNA deacylase
MRVVIQKVLKASVEVDGSVVANIKNGLLVFLGITHDDDENDSKYIINKIINLRVFLDENGVMNKSVLDVDGQILIVSQFTLYGDCKKGNRPSYQQALEPEKAKVFYEKFVDLLKKSLGKTESGIFGASMKVQLVNDGPVTILLSSKKVF